MKKSPSFYMIHRPYLLQTPTQRWMRLAD